MFCSNLPPLQHQRWRLQQYEHKQAAFAPPKYACITLQAKNMSRLKLQNFKNILRINPRLRFRKGWLFWVMKIWKICFWLNLIKLFLPLTATLPNKTKKPALVIAKCSVLMTIRWTVHEIHIYSIQRKKKKWTNRKKYMIIFFNFKLL